MRVAANAKAGLMEALGRMAERLADRRFDQGAQLMRAAERMGDWDSRKQAKESRGLQALDQSTVLRRSAEQAFVAARHIRGEP